MDLLEAAQEMVKSLDGVTTGHPAMEALLDLRQAVEQEVADRTTWHVTCDSHHPFQSYTCRSQEQAHKSVDYSRAHGCTGMHVVCARPNDVGGREVPAYEYPSQEATHA